MQCFEKVLKVYPNSRDTLKVLGSLYAHSEPADLKERAERKKKAREVLKKVVDACPNDIEVLIDMAQLTENCDPQVHFLISKSTFISHVVFQNTHVNAYRIISGTVSIAVFVTVACKNLRPSFLLEITAFCRCIYTCTHVLARVNEHITYIY